MDNIDRVCAQKKQWLENLQPMKDGAAIRPYNEVGWHLSCVSSILVEPLLVMKLEERMEHGYETMAIGSTTVRESEFILDGQEDEEMTGETSLVTEICPSRRVGHFKAPF